MKRRLGLVDGGIIGLRVTCAAKHACTDAQGSVLLLLLSGRYLYQRVILGFHQRLGLGGTTAERGHREVCGQERPPEASS